MFSTDTEFSARWLADSNPQMLVPARSARIVRATEGVFDLLVIGGGIHGVSVAKIAAQMGLSVLLLEQGDYASGTSSRSSKMAHGGLRYLEMFDFEQVFEGIRAREALFERVPNLVRPERFLIPIPRGAHWLKCKLGVGLTLYDLLVRSPERKHRWVKGQAQVFAGGAPLAGCYEYTDGLMSDSRLVFEFLASAQSFGCCALNYAEAMSLVQRADGMVQVQWSDKRGGGHYESRARCVVNCAGPWAPFLHPEDTAHPLPKVRYSRGSHLVFSVPWREPSLFLPLAEKGRYYFVWPHPSGTLVGTTEREVDQLESDPIPSLDEVDEILNRLARDLPHSGLTRETLHYAFAGVRTLPMRTRKVLIGAKGVSQLSRKHIWQLTNGVLTLLGGKYTTFAWTATEGVRAALKAIGADVPEIPDPLTDLPSVTRPEESARMVEELVVKFGASQEAVVRAISRLGRLVLRYVDRPHAWGEVAPGVLMLEVLHAIEIEQAETVEDVMRRRIELEYFPIHGCDALDAVEAQLALLVGVDTAQKQREEFLKRLDRIRLLCAGLAPAAAS